VGYVQPVSPMRDLASRYWFEAAIVLLALVGVLDLVVRRDAPDAPQSSLWFVVFAVTSLVLAIIVRRRFPFAGLTTYWLLAAVIAFIDWRLIPFMDSLFAIGMAVAFLLGNLRDARQAQTGLAVVLAGAAVVVYRIPGHSGADLVLIPLEFGISWFAGYALRERAQRAEAAEVRASQAEHERETAARIAVAEERARIARELHDIVAHAVSVMVLQVGAVRHKLPGTLAEDRDALKGVERAGRSALTEMRQLLGAMRADGENVDFAPQPGLDRLDALVQEVNRAGLPVRLQIDGEAFTLPRGIDISAYRIVQEGLTNALKHAHASKAEVTLHYHPRHIGVDVFDDGVGAGARDGSGHGLIGIRERVKLYGGEMEAGGASEGGFLLTTRLPLSRREP
jgi:signal transduction histidine kinase